MDKQIFQNGRQPIITALSRKLHKVLLIPPTLLPFHTSSLPPNLLSKWKTNIACNMQTDNN